MIKLSEEESTDLDLLLKQIKEKYKEDEWTFFKIIGVWTPIILSIGFIGFFITIKLGFITLHILEKGIVSEIGFRLIETLGIILALIFPMSLYVIQRISSDYREVISSLIEVQESYSEQYIKLETTKSDVSTLKSTFEKLNQYLSAVRESITVMFSEETKDFTKDLCVTFITGGSSILFIISILIWVSISSSAVGAMGIYLISFVFVVGLLSIFNFISLFLRKILKLNKVHISYMEAVLKLKTASKNV